MIRFDNDYNRSAHSSILKALTDTQRESYIGYGRDEWCIKAEALIKKMIGAPLAHVHFIPAATLANLLVVSSLHSTQSIICPDSGHIHCHEAGSIENTGHKILTLPNTDGKITAEQIQLEASSYYDEGEQDYLTQPKMVYLSFTTELGTIYSKKELRAISEVCRNYNMYLFVDGARMGYGLEAKSNDLTLKDFAELTDVFYIGGTKCGALFGEALVINNPEIHKNFRRAMKQNGAVLSKGWLMGLQFYVLLNNGLYFDITQQANFMADKIREAFNKKDIPLYVKNDTNQIFVILANEQAEKLSQKYAFQMQIKLDEDHSVSRFCTAWYTTNYEVDSLIKDIELL